jgi:hypothetical protein
MTLGHGASADYFLKYGNIDLEHRTQVGAKAGISNYDLFEIGHPVALKMDGRRTFVKAEIYRGNSRVAEWANQVWDSLTKVAPPARWYPSVGGEVLEKAQGIDPATKAPRTGGEHAARVSQAD